MNIRFKWLFLILLFAAPAFAQNVRVDNVAFSSVQGFPFLAGATITICTAAGTGVPCTPTVTGTCLSISDAVCNQSATITSDAFGNYGFWIQPGSYTYTITKAGFGGFGPRALTLAVPSVGTGPGTFTNLTVSGTATTTNTNGTISTGNATYPCTAAGVNAALVAARGTGVSGTGAGIVDATACTGNVTMNAQINVGDSTFDPVVLKLPASGGWDFNMTDGTSCGIKQFSKTSIIGPGGAIGQPFALLALTGANMKAVYCTDPSPSSGSSYIRAEGFAIKEQAGVTLSTAVADIRNTFDVSSFTDLIVGGTAGVALNVSSTCCGTTFRRVGVDCVNAATCLPIQVNANVNDTLFDSVSANHSGTGLNQVSFAGATFGTVFQNLYMESNTTGADTTTPLVAFSGTSGGNVTFQGGLANILSGSTTQYVFLRNSGAGAYSFSLKNFSMLPGTGPDFNCINDVQEGFTFNISTAGIEKNNGVCPNYDGGNVISRLIVGRTGAPGAMFTIDYNAATDQPAAWRNSAGATWLVGDGVAANNRFSFFSGAERASIDLSSRLETGIILADKGSICTNGELALSAGWQSTGSATVTAVAGNGQTCSWTITTGTTTAANPTVTDTLTTVLPAATTVCEMNIHGGTHAAAAGEGFQQTALSATAPVFTFNGTPTAGGTTYFVTRRCGP